MQRLSLCLLTDQSACPVLQMLIKWIALVQVEKNFSRRDLSITRASAILASKKKTLGILPCLASESGPWAITDLSTGERHVGVDVWQHFRLGRAFSIDSWQRQFYMAWLQGGVAFEMITMCGMVSLQCQCALACTAALQGLHYALTQTIRSLCKQRVKQFKGCTHNYLTTHRTGLCAILHQTRCRVLAIGVV